MTWKHHREPPVGRSAFTLIELLAGMAILSILVLMLGRFFTESTRAWDTGTKQAEMNSTGRAIMDFVVSDLSTAVADDILRFRLDSHDFPTYFPDRNDMVAFDSLGESPDSSQPRSAARVTYYLRELKDANGADTGRFRLMRNRTKDPTKIYSGDPITNPLASGAATPIAENVVSFNVWAYPSATGGDKPDYYSEDEDDELPVWVDIYLELLSESDAKQAALLSGNATNQQAFVRLHAKGFLARAHFPNRIGYSK